MTKIITLIHRVDTPDDMNERDDNIAYWLDDGYEVVDVSYVNLDKGLHRYIIMRQDEPAFTTGALTTTRLLSIERDTTKGSGSPMWRCTTQEGEPVNIFQHADAERDTFHLFEQAGWGAFLGAAPMGKLLNIEIAVTMIRDGKWWKIISVESHLDEPDAFIEELEHLNQRADVKVLEHLRASLGTLLDDSASGEVPF